MAYERKTKTPEELKAFRQENIRKAHSARREKARLRNVPGCHPDRPMFGRTGLCRECYVGVSAPPEEITPEQAVQIAEKLGDKEEAEKIRREAIAILHKRLPDYARAHFEAAKAAAMKGDARPAEWALQHIKAPGGATVIEPPAKGPSEGGVKILIGVNLGGLPGADGASNLMEAKPVRALVDAPSEAVTE